MSSSSPASAASGTPAPAASPPSSLPFEPREFEMVDVKPSEVEFLDTLKVKKNEQGEPKGLVVTYKVRVREKDCVLKVFAGNDFFNRYWLESEAYFMLESKGFCKRGDVPKLYTIFEKMDVQAWPAMWQFQHQEHPPDAILVEYIPNAEKIQLSNFSQEKMDKLSQILFGFHDIGLLHGDVYPRNMMVVQGTPQDRVFWLDFDSSLLVDREKCDEWTEERFIQERDIMIEFATGLAQDAKNGKLEVVWDCYYE